MGATVAYSNRPRRARKEETIEVRTATATKALLAQAAHARHTTMSEFIVSSAVRAAESTLADQRVFQLSNDEWKHFMALLEAPAVPDPDIVTLARERAPWGKLNADAPSADQ